MGIVVCVYDWRDAGIEEAAFCMANIAPELPVSARVRETANGPEREVEFSEALQTFFSRKLFSLSFGGDASDVSLEASHGSRFRYCFLRLPDGGDTLERLNQMPLGVEYAYALSHQPALGAASIGSFGLGFPEVGQDDLDLVAAHPWDAWGADLMNALSYRNGQLRDVYPLNFIGQAHVIGWGERRNQSLIEVCATSGRMGSISTDSLGIYHWVLNEGEIAFARDLALRSGKIVS